MYISICRISVEININAFAEDRNILLAVKEYSLLVNLTLEIFFV